MSLPDRKARILIVGGGGVIGSSTALELARRGYEDVRLLDMFENPSANSAGNDKNKIAGDDSAGVWGQVGQEAWSMWMQDPVFKPYAHQVGRLDLTSKSEREQRLRQRYDAIVGEGRGESVEWLDTPKSIIDKAPHLKHADLTGWKGLYVKPAGWVAAREALNGVGYELRRLGVRTAFGTSGTFHSLILEDSHRGRSQDVALDRSAAQAALQKEDTGPRSDQSHPWSNYAVKGVRCADGTEWYGDIVVIAAGAWTPALIDLEGQCTSKAWAFAHVQLTPEEAKYLQGIPTMYNHELGFYMEPEPSTGMIKLVNEFAGYTNIQPWLPFPRNIAHSLPCSPFTSDPVKMSVPRSHALNPSDTIPTECAVAIESLVANCLPFLKGRQLIQKAMCWCTDTVDSNWLICRDPRWSTAEQSAKVIIASGDSGQTFKMFPVVGRQVADLIENKLAPERQQLWRWRPNSRDVNGTGRAGEQPKDLKDVPGWKHDAFRSHL